MKILLFFNSKYLRWFIVVVFFVAVGFNKYFKTIDKNNRVDFNKIHEAERDALWNKTFAIDYKYEQQEALNNYLGEKEIREISYLYDSKQLPLHEYFEGMDKLTDKYATIDSLSLESWFSEIDSTGRYPLYKTPHDLDVNIKWCYYLIRIMPWLLVVSLALFFHAIEKKLIK